MNDKQFEQIKRELRAEMTAKGVGWINGTYIKPSKEYELRTKELDCISMINSILCYSCRGFKDAESVLQYEEKSYHNYLSDYVKTLGRDKVIILIQDQINSIAEIKDGVFTDNEGLTYSSIIWREN